MEDRGLTFDERVWKPKAKMEPKRIKKNTCQSRRGIRMIILSYSGLAETGKWYVHPYSHCIKSSFSQFFSLVTFKIGSSASFSFPRHFKGPRGSEDVAAQN